MVIPALIRNKPPITLAIALLIALLQPPHEATASAPANGSPFDDVKPNYASEAILHLASLGVLDGTGPRRFEPLKPVTRAEFVAMLDRLFGLVPVQSAIPAFADLKESAWHYGWVQAGLSVGFVQGVSTDSFQPGRAVTRQEAAVLLARAIKQSPNPNVDAPPPYHDAEEIASWAEPYTSRLYRLSLMKGDSNGDFRPGASLTRQEAAATLDRLFDDSDWAAQFLTSTSPDGGRIQLGWQYGQSTSQFEKQIDSACVNTLSPRWYFLSATGSLSDGTDPSLVAWAHQRGKKVWAMVGNRSDPETTRLMLASAERRRNFVAQLTDAASRYGLDGLNLDFENVEPTERHLFTQFVSELSNELHALKKVLSVNVSPDLGTDWTEAFDYAALGASADYIVLMGYDEHWGGSPVAGSVSSIPWLQAGLKTLLSSGVPAGRTILALPFYTREWQTKDGVVTSAEWSLAEQNGYLRSAGTARPRWNDPLGQYTASYRTNGVLRQIWLEDGRSLARKVWMGEENHLAGYAYWYMGGESPDVWDSLRNAFRYHALTFESRKVKSSRM